MNGATVISIDESILPSGNSDTVFVEGNRNIESEINSGLETPSSFVWGQYDEGRSIIVNVSTIENTYDEISKWRKNTFLVPFGKTGKEFIDTLKELINKWNNGSEMEFIALKVAIILLALCLQKPGPESKSKDHQVCLAKPLVLWKKGEVDTILREGRMIQKRLGNSRRATDPPNRAKIFEIL